VTLLLRYTRQRHPDLGARGLAVTLRRCRGGAIAMLSWDRQGCRLIAVRVLLLREGVRDAPGH
jgi:hypothetical protein